MSLIQENLGVRVVGLVTVGFAAMMFLRVYSFTSSFSMPVPAGEAAPR